MINLGNIELADLRLGASQVKAAYFGSKQIWGGEEPVPVGDWLCFTAEQANSTLRLDVSYAPSTIYLETSTDGRTWTDYSWTNSTGDTLTLASVGDKVYFRAKTENQTIGSSDTKFYQFVMTGQIAASGNIQTLLKADGSRTDAPAYCYSYMFYDCSALTTAPELPATTLANYCYESMFSYCTSLTTAPALPATTLADYCYENMFSSCTSLTTAPALPATNLVIGCYSGMFEYCSSLTTAPELPAMSLASGCYQSMFYGCSSLSSMEVAFTTWNPQTATSNWVRNVAASGTFTCPGQLPSIIGNSNIPTGWTVVHPAIDWLRFDILADDTTIDLVAEGEGGLKAPDLEFSVDDGATWTQWVPGTDYPHEMAGAVVYVRAGATGNTGFADPDHPSQYWHFTSDDLFSVSGNIMYLLSRDGSTGLSEGCFLRLFDGCTMLVDASGLELPAMTLADYCYEGMFRGCTSLSAAPELPATTLATNCYHSMLSACTSLSVPPELPATTLADRCYQYMFRGCSSLTAAPALPATTLVDGCYKSMFSQCSSLSSVEVPFTAWSPSTATNSWLREVAASGTFTCPAELPDTRGVNNIPTGWNVVHPVEYIEADSQQYLDTGYEPQVGDEIELTWANTDNTKENKGFLVGSSWSGGGRVADGEVKPWIYPGITGAGFSTPSNFYTNNMVIGEKFTDHMYVGTLASGKYGYTMYRHLTDTLYSYNEWSGSVRNTNLTLCGVSGDAYSLANKRIYGWKHWRNGALIRDMIPINHNGVGAMYDSVSQTVFTSGSGVDFLLPNAS